MENRSDVFMLPHPHQDSSCAVLNVLQFLQAQRVLHSGNILYFNDNILNSNPIACTSLRLFFNLQIAFF